MLAREKGKSRWVRCPNCGHKLFKVISENSVTAIIPVKEHFDEFAGDFDKHIEIKCHSCKEIVIVA